MKNLVKITLMAILTSVVLFSCNKNNDIQPNLKMTEAESVSFFKENMSIFDARVRTLNESFFVKELYIANFADRSWDKSEIGFDNTLFKDNGEGNDLIANDGIFTSVEKFNFNDKIVYDKEVELKSVMNKMITSPSFKHTKKLNDLKAEYRINTIYEAEDGLTGRDGPKAELTCDVEICSSGCIADWIWEGFGCICVSNCTATIGWG